MPDSQELSSVRTHPRVQFATPVEVWSGGYNSVGQSENISLGGLMLQNAHCFAPKTNLEVLFNLPNARSIRTHTVVVHSDLRLRAGVQFLSLPPDARRDLEQFITSLLGHTRRSGRLVKRFNVTLQRPSRDNVQESMAETVVVTARGGQLVCRGRYMVGEEVFLWWPEGKRGAPAKIVFRRTGGPSGLVELGFEFEHPGNFWGFDFPASN
jgi:hypothetical protein